MAANYYNQYRKHFNKIITTPQLNQIKRGHLISFRYESDYSSPFPKLALVLTSRWGGKLHCLKLNEMPMANFKIWLAKMISKRHVDLELGRIVYETDIYRFPLKSEANRPKQFYKSLIYPDPRYHKYYPYRTYEWRKITQEAIIHFKYPSVGLKVTYSPQVVKQHPLVETLNVK